MKFARKMVLVPAEDYSVIIKAQAQDIPASVKKAVALNDQMRSIANHPKPSKCKAYKYQKLLHDFQHYKNKQGQTLPSSTQPILNQHIDRSDSFSEYLPHIYRGKARVLLAHLEKHGITWSGKGELTLPSGEVIQHSHGADLLREALVGSKKKSASDIKGWDNFVQHMAESNVPKSLLGKKKTLQQLLQHKTSSPTKADREGPMVPKWLSL